MCNMDRGIIEGQAFQRTHVMVMIRVAPLHLIGGTQGVVGASGDVSRSTTTFSAPDVLVYLTTKPFVQILVVFEASLDAEVALLASGRR